VKEGQKALDAITDIVLAYKKRGKEQPESSLKKKPPSDAKQTAKSKPPARKPRIIAER